MTRAGVLAAVEECRQQGRESFRSLYGFGRAQKYELVVDGHRYDSKAIVGVAHRYSVGTLLSSEDFSGGARTVAHRLRALGFAVDELPAGSEDSLPASRIGDEGGEHDPPVQLTAAALLDKLGSLNTHRNVDHGLPSRHQPLALLWALSRIAAGRPRLSSWSTFRAEVGELMAEFGLPGSKITPEYPFWHLRGSGLWEVHGIPEASGFKPSAGVFNTVNPEAGPTHEAAELLSDPTTRLDAVLTLRDTYFEETDLGALLDRVGLAGFGTADGLTGDVAEAQQASTLVERRLLTALRLVRNTTLVHRVKELYGHVCQVCGTSLQYMRGPYSEAAHIRGLGFPHNGPDELSNLLCLCPNHHVLFDGLEIYIDADGFVRHTHGGEPLGPLRRHADHRIDDGHLRYHRTLCQLNAPTSEGRPDRRREEVLSRIGTALGEAALPAKKRSDAVDAWVALAAARHGSAVIFTTDPGDIHACLTVLSPADVHVVAI